MITFDTNLRARSATTQYTNFNYNSAVKFGEKFFCASETGLVELVNDPPEEEVLFELATMDFGIANEKRLRAFYIGYEADGNLTLTVSTDLGDSETYTIPASASGQHTRKVVISRKVRGRYWTFQIKGKNVTFSIDDIKVLPVYRGMGVDRT